MRTIKVLLDEDAPFRPPLKVYIDGVEWNDVFGVEWNTKFAEVNQVTLRMDAKFEIEYVNRDDFDAS
jgi:hypothetical protein